jgi:hypothetical protein
MTMQATWRAPAIHTNWSVTQCRGGCLCFTAVACRPSCAGWKSEKREKSKDEEEGKRNRLVAVSRG